MPKTKLCSDAEQAHWVNLFWADRDLGSYTGRSTIEATQRYDEHEAWLQANVDPEATERTAEYAVAAKMSADDLIDWALNDPEHVARVARGLE